MLELFAWDKYGWLDRPFVVGDDGVITFGAMQTLVNQWRGELRQSGVGQRTRVAVGIVDPVHTIALSLAIWCEGHVVCPLNLRLPQYGVDEAVSYIDSPLMIDSIPGNFDQSLANDTALTLPLDTTEMAMILFTSGSSGMPKACCLSLQNLWKSALGALENMHLMEGDQWLLSLPLFHVGGWGIVMRSLVSGTAVNIQHPVDSSVPSSVTHVSCVPTQLYRWLEDGVELAMLKGLLVGGAPIPPSLIERALDHGLSLYTTYGCTEMASQVTTSQSYDGAEALQTAGNVLPYRELTLDEEGQILVKGLCLAMGYWRDGKICDLRNSNGWYETGDLGALDEEGRLLVKGRIDNLIISGGENIQPEEIEHVIMQSDMVQRCVVVPREDEQWGHRPVAFCDWKGESTEEKLRSFLQRHLPKYKIPERILPWPDQIESHGLKINRNAFHAYIGNE